MQQISLGEPSKSWREAQLLVQALLPVPHLSYHTCLPQYPTPAIPRSRQFLLSKTQNSRLKTSVAYRQPNTSRLLMKAVYRFSAKGVDTKYRKLESGNLGNRLFDRAITVSGNKTSRVKNSDELPRSCYTKLSK